MELRHVRYFIAVAEELNFNKAAARLHIAQPPLSTQIKDLERELGVRLFNRTTRGTTLTPEGDIFLLEARQILDQVNRARRAVNQSASGELGRLRVIGVAHAFSEMLPRVVSRFRREHPNVVLDIQQGATQEGLDAVLSGTADAAFVRQGESMAGLQVMPLTFGQFEAVVPIDHRLASAARVGIKDLVNESFVMPARAVSPYYYHQTLSILTNAGIAPRTVLEVNSMQAQLGCVACGMGVALVQASGKDFRMTNVSWIPLEATVTSVELAVAWRAGTSTPALGYLLGLAKQEAAAVQAARADERPPFAASGDF